MKEFIDKLISRLEEEEGKALSDDEMFAYSYTIAIVNELAEEYKGGWIACSERLPEVDGRYLCSYNYKDGGRNYVQVLSYYAYEEKPHFQHEGYEGLEVVAWCELPAPYTEGE